MPLPRTLYAVPQTLEKRLDILHAFRRLAAQDDERIRQRRAEIASIRRELEEIAQEANKFFRELPLLIQSELRKAGYNPNEPRVPKRSHGGGQWTSDGGSTPSATPQSDGIAGTQYAANNPPGKPPAVPPGLPATKQATYAFLKAAAYWLADAALAGEPVGDFILALEAADWLSSYLPYVSAYLDPPKTLEELQQDALSPASGYNIHHIVEQAAAAQDGFPDSMINGPDNLVRISTLKHWQINAWYSTPNKNFGGVSPRDYLRGKSWDERRQVGLDALTMFGVLAP
jgi:hypothetical protein